MPKSTEEAAEVIPKGSVMPRPAGLTAMQDDFAMYYVTMEGKQTPAARAAGFAFPANAAQRLMQTPHVLKRIVEYSVVRLQRHLPALIRAQLDIALDTANSPKDRLQAIRDIQDRAGLVAQKAPLVAVQNNTTHNHGDKGDKRPTVLIKRIWDRKSARMSRIDVPMRDTLDDEGELVEAIEILQGEGGVASPGSPAGTRLIPPHSDAKPVEIAAKKERTDVELDEEEAGCRTGAGAGAGAGGGGDSVAEGNEVAGASAAGAADGGGGSVADAGSGRPDGGCGGEDTDDGCSASGGGEGDSGAGEFEGADGGTETGSGPSADGVGDSGGAGEAEGHPLFD